ncbi:MAG: histidine phosphatase family protein [Neomegalonema sp.]|nr:histidine phosphatase family protein [Neomegalonema sp.]
MVRWWWVRHGPTNARGFCGWTDSPADLSDGRSLSALRTALPDHAMLLTSDLSRSIDTADAIGRRTWLRREPDAAFREQNFGAWEGLSYDEPEGAEQFWRDPAAAAPPEGESFAALCARVATPIMEISRGDDDEIVAVAHAGVIRAALALALTLPPLSALAFEISPLSLTRIDWIREAKAWRVGCVNMQM